MIAFEDVCLAPFTKLATVLVCGLNDSYTSGDSAECRVTVSSYWCEGQYEPMKNQGNFMARKSEFGGRRGSCSLSGERDRGRCAVSCLNRGGDG